MKTFGAAQTGYWDAYLPALPISAACGWLFKG